jgi:hypothetical protein
MSTALWPTEIVDIFIWHYGCYRNLKISCSPPFQTVCTPVTRSHATVSFCSTSTQTWLVNDGHLSPQLFSCCDKYLRKSASKEQRCFGSQFERFQSMVSWLCCYGACGEAEHRGREHMVKQSCSLHGGWEMSQYTCQGHAFSDLTSSAKGFTTYYGITGWGPNPEHTGF